MICNQTEFYLPMNIKRKTKTGTFETRFNYVTETIVIDDNQSHAINMNS